MEPRTPMDELLDAYERRFRLALAEFTAAVERAQRATVRPLPRGDDRV